MYWITGILGVVFAVSPWLFGYADNSVALWTSLLVGVVTIIVSVIEGVQADKEQWEYWTAAILGIVTIFAPCVLGLRQSTSAVWTTVVMGALVTIFAGSRLFMRST